MLANFFSLQEFVISFLQDNFTFNCYDLSKSDLSWMVFKVLDVKLYLNAFNNPRGQSRGEIESVFGHFTEFNIRKTDSLQNSILEKLTLHKIQYEENGLFTKFNLRKTNPSQNSI